jgi:hypothetical protein
LFSRPKTGENFIAWAKENRKTTFQKCPIISSPSKTIVEKGDSHLFPVVFRVGIAIAKDAWVNHSHAELHTIQRSPLASVGRGLNCAGKPGARLARTGAAQKT